MCQVGDKFILGSSNIFKLKAHGWQLNSLIVTPSLSLPRRGTVLIVTLISFSLSLWSCAHKNILLDSSPSAGEIQVTLPSGDAKVLGAGPVSFNAEEYQRYQFIFLSAKKDGRQSDMIFVPRELYDRVGEIQIPLKNSIQLTGSPKSNHELNDAVLSQVLQAQTYIHKKNYDEAQNILVNLTGQYPQSATLWSLLGSSYYLAKKKTKALEAFEKALALNPQATDVQRLVEQLRKE